MAPEVILAMDEGVYNGKVSRSNLKLAPEETLLPDNSVYSTLSLSTAVFCIVVS